MKATSYMARNCFHFILIISPFCGLGQDTTISVAEKIITLREVVVRNRLDVPDFIARVQNDTSFYKAFRNLRILGFTSRNDIRMMDRKGSINATLRSKTRQLVKGGCRSMEVLEEKTTGDIYDNKGNWNYYTASMYASLFLSKGTVCGESNIVRGELFGANGKSGIEKHKEQLKKLIFNPGAKISGIPFIGNKVAIFDNPQAALYDFIIDMGDHFGRNCYIFTVRSREDLTAREKEKTVIKNMTTWFESENMEIVARNYDLSYDAGVYDFDVHMEVQLATFGELLVPTLIRYTGNWHAIFKKREKGFFTATISDFSN